MEYTGDSLRRIAVQNVQSLRSVQAVQIVSDESGLELRKRLERFERLAPAEPISLSTPLPAARHRRPCPAAFKCSVAARKPNSTATTSASIYHAFRVGGTTLINGQPLHWQKGDTFVVPLWSWHEHANATSSEEAILFSMHDEPILRAFRLYGEKDRVDKRN